MKTAHLQNINSNEVIYPQVYEIKGAGASIVNGIYIFHGLCNDRPYYTKNDNSASLWYFSTTLFPASYWCGWYISKSVNTELTSASEDYYSAYSHGKLPPSIGWVARLPGISPTAGCGANPPPSFVGAPSGLTSQTSPSLVTQDHLEQLVIDGFGCSPWIPRRIRVFGAGSTSANGLYTFAGEISHRPYFQKIDGLECLWYFSTCPISQSTSGAISYNGWYLSNAVGTSSYSSAQDMYTCYTTDCIPHIPISSEAMIELESEIFQKPLTSLLTQLQKPKHREWVVRYPGLPPFAGCGVSPVPSIQYARPASDSPSFVMLLRLSLPNGDIKSIQISELDTIFQVKLICEEILQIHFYRIRFLLRGVNLSLLSNNDPHKDSLQENDHQRVVDTAIAMGDIITVEIIVNPSHSPHHHSVSRNICLVGAGPVGLWIAIQLKILQPNWTITCYEKRAQYERSHALSITSTAFQGMVEWCPGRPAAAELSLLKDRWIPRTRTVTVESELKTLALNIGIKILYGQEITSLTDHLRSTSNENSYDLVICCDGAKSLCRQHLLANTPSTADTPTSTTSNSNINIQEFKKQKELGSLLQVKFEAHGEVCLSKGQLAQFLQNLPATEEFFSILPGNFDSEKCCTPMTVFALLSSEVSSSIKSGEWEACSSFVHSDLEAVLNHNICHGGIITGTMKTNILPVSYSVASSVIGKIMNTSSGTNIPIFLAGDAAMGLPLEKGLNYGWRIASRLCHYLAYSSDFESSSLAYQSYFNIESTAAIESVERQYSHYVRTIQSASSLRSFLRPFASLMTNTK